MARMVYLTDGPSLMADRDGGRERTRLIAVMLYVLPFLLTPLVLGSVALYFAAQTAHQVSDLRTIESALDDLQQRLIAGGPTMSLDQREAITERIADLSSALQQARAAHEWGASRPWAAAFIVLGVALLAAWGIAFHRLLRPRRASAEG